MCKLAFYMVYYAQSIGFQFIQVTMATQTKTTFKFTTAEVSTAFLFESTLKDMFKVLIIDCVLVFKCLCAY